MADTEFLGLDSDDHLLPGREPASREFAEAVRTFLSRDSRAARLESFAPTLKAISNLHRQ